MGNNINFIQMKSAILALFLGATAAVQLNDAPPYFNEPTWNERMPSAAGLVQTTSACVAAGVNGVTCGPSDAQYFATGMNGDEDLGQDIIMKGEKFHYKQLAQGDDKAAPVEAGGAEKVSVLETPICKSHTTFYGQKNTGQPC